MLGTDGTEMQNGVKLGFDTAVFCVAQRLPYQRRA
jgi:hypothetical protein